MSSLSQNKKTEKKTQKNKIIKKVKPVHVRVHLRALRDLISRSKSTATREKGWLSVDSKGNTGEDATVQLLKKEFAFIRGAARAAIGNRPFRTTAPMTFTLTATVTSGIVNTVLTGGTTTVSPTNITEQTSFASIFDEVKVHGGLVDFLYANPHPVGTLNADARPVIGFDPTDATVATNTNEMCQLQHHKTMDVGVVNAGGMLPPSGNHHRFSFVIPKGDMIEVSSAFVADVWQDMSNAQAVGAIKFYHIGSAVTAIIVGTGQLMLDMSFRCRE
jgi:hypothetical protein